ncbi:MAG: mitochondrial fission ELM1 family protein, partial [Campylobacter sp.]|nr:mitochondrial fission ELM1 family protein [Campylobacter sp.]
YYALKYYAEKFNAKSVAMMNVKGYRNNFDLTFIMNHDLNEHQLQNSINVPVNINFPSKGGFYKPTKKAIGFIIGGTNEKIKFDEILIFNIIQEIKNKFINYEILITTSPRTPLTLEKKLESINFDFSVFYSTNRINPINDFCEYCEYVFITADSTSMISEAVCNGMANVEIIGYPNNKQGKYQKFITNLQNDGFLHIYDGNLSRIPSKKISLSDIFKSINL